MAKREYEVHRPGSREWPITGPATELRDIHTGKRITHEDYRRVMSRKDTYENRLKREQQEAPEHRKGYRQPYRSGGSGHYSTVAVAGLLGGALFLSPNITGNAVAGLSAGSSNILGACLLIAGLFFGLIWIKNKKK